MNVVSLEKRLDTVRSIAGAKKLAHAYQTATRSEIDAVQQARLRTLAERARQSSPFYGQRLAGIDLDGPDLLRRLPRLDKATMIANLAEILTDERLRSVDLGSHVGSLAGDELLFDEYRVLVSGGTSGVRAFYVYDRSAWVEAHAAFGASALLLGLQPRLPRVRVATIWAASPAHMSARMVTSLRSPVYDRLSLSAMAPISEMVAQLNEFRPESVSGYPSILALLALEQAAGRLQISPRVVMTVSEQCTPGMRSRIVAAWKVEPFNAYACTEGGGMALECDRHGGMHILETQVILEVVDDQGEPVPDGEPGARVLVTNLFNHAQPLIRFELTDLVTMAPEPCPCGRQSRRIMAIEGRTDDIMRLRDSEGRQVPVHPNHFAEAVESVHAVTAYQVVQRGDEVEIAVVGPTDVVAVVQHSVCANLAQLGLEHTAVRVRQVSQIPRPDGASSKFKLVRANG